MFGMFKKKDEEAPKEAAATPAAAPPAAAAGAPTAASSKAWESGRLQVQVLGARGLAAADKGGTSDPFVSVKLIGATGAELPKPHNRSFKTEVVKKNLAPRFKKENPFVYDGVPSPLPWLRFEVWDWNAGLMGVGSGKAKSLGMADVALDEIWKEQPDHGPDGGGLAQWLQLRALAGGKKGAALAVSGEVEVRFALRGGSGDAAADAIAAADEARWFVTEDDDEKEKEPNTIRIAVVRARSLPIVDKNIMSRGGSSDPFVRLEMAGEKFRTKTVKKDVNPTWMEVFELPLRRPKKQEKNGAEAGVTLESLEVYVEDEGMVGSSLMGRITINPQSLPKLDDDGAAPTTWHPLNDAKNRPAPDHGAVMLACKLVYDASRDDNEDREFFDEENSVDEEAVAAEKPPNELRVAVARARGIKAMDAAALFSSKGKTSDPYVEVSVVGSSVKMVKTKVVKKTLTPVWNTEFTFDIEPAGANVEGPKEIEFQLWDEDMLGRDYLGLVVIPLPLLMDAKHKPVRGWYPLGEKAQRAGGDGTLGQLLVAAQWRYNPNLDFSPFREADDAPGKQPNDLRVALFRGRGLPIKDKNLLSKGGSSDPFVKFTILGGEKPKESVKAAKAQEKLMKWQSSRRDKTLDPVWREVFSRELRLPDPNDLSSVETWTPPVLRCECMDYDAVSAADFMGLVEIPLEILTVDRPKVSSSWHALQADSTGKLSSNVGGEIYVEVQWRYNPEYDFDPWADFVDELFPDKPANELRVALVRGRGLSVKDKAVLWGNSSSDPRVEFSLKTQAGDDARTAASALKPWKSSTRKKTLEPAWCEQWTFPLDSTAFEQMPALRCTCEDVDELTKADYMGHVDLELADFAADKKRQREWHQLVSIDGESSNVTGELEIIVMWCYNPVHDFDPWPDDEQDEYAEKKPNELCIAVVQARGLAVKDKALLWGEGSSDPRARFLVVDTKSLHGKTKVASKTLNPVWRETFELSFVEDAYYEADARVEFGAAGPLLSMTVEDYDAVSGADFMGRVDVPLGTLRDKKRQRAWHSLQADSKEEGGKSSSNVMGEVELVLKWRYNKALDFDPFLDEDIYLEKPANELRIGLAQARNLAIKDKNLLSKGGSSDPRVKFSIPKAQLECTSTTKQKSLNPRWSEVFTMLYTKGPDDSQPPVLEVLVEDVDELTSADFMGRLQIELLPLHDHVRQRAWHSLQALATNEAKESSNVAGDIELIVQWWYNPAHDFDPFSADTAALEERYAEKQPNELRVALVQARGLAVKDKNLFSKGGSSDPFVNFAVRGGDLSIADKKTLQFKSTTKFKTLTPVWREIFQLPLTYEASESGERPRLEIKVEDEDELTGSDLMGFSSIELSHLLRQPGDFSGKPHREWHTLTTEEGKSQNVTGDVELILQWWYSPALDFSPFEDNALDDGSEEPNELLIALVQARGLAIKDKNLFSKGGSSDPRATFKITSTELQCVSTVKQKTLTPRWCETFSLPFSPGSGEKNPFLDVVLDDVDELTSSDFMGRVLIELAPLEVHRKVHREWYSLQAQAEDTGLKKSSNVLGEVELVLQWRFNPALSFAPFDVTEPIPEGKQPNELAIALVQARGLALADKNTLSSGGTSDPVVTFRVVQEAETLEFESTVVRKTMNPMWKEVFTKPLRGESMKLEVIVEDWDAASSRDFMGGVLIDLAPAETGVKPKSAWYELTSLEGQSSSSVAITGEVELIVAWRFNPLLDFDPFSEKDATPEKEPNELRIGLSQARDLAVKDKNLISASSSDPRFKFEIFPSESAKPPQKLSTCKEKTLNPTWRETFALECSEQLKLRCVCEDVDGFSSADFMGVVDIDFADLLGQKVVKKWYALEANSELDKTTNVTGEVELVLQWRYNAALDYDPFPEVDESGEPANELRVCVVRGRDLAIKDKNLISAGGSSDPRVTLTVGSSLKRKTKTLNKTLDPVWKEIFSLPLSQERPPGKPPPTLTILCEDVDEITSADFMGECVLDLDSFFTTKDKKRKMWCTLVSNQDKDKTENVTGEIEVVVQWWHNPARAFTPFKDEQDPKFADREPNELRIGLFQACGLAVMDKNLFSKGGSSDPRCRIQIRGSSTHKVESKVLKKTVDPLWREVFVMALPRGPASLEVVPPVLDCVCEDVDEISAADLMGNCEVDLTEMMDKKVHRVWRSLGEEKGDLELVLHWHYNPLTDYSPFEDDDDPHMGEEVNELRIALIRGLNLPIMDKNLLSAGGSSDPRVTFALSRVDAKFKSHSKPKTLDPLWHEQFVRSYSPSSTEEESKLTCVCEDVDSLSSADKMGEFTVDLAPLAVDRKVKREWYSLEGGGHVEMALQWWFNPVESFSPFAVSKRPEKPANELRIGLFRARGLPIADKNLISAGGSSDPRVQFSLRQGERKVEIAKDLLLSTHQSRTLEPVWKEVFEVPLPRGPESQPWPILDVLVEDWDEVSSADKMCTTTIDLNEADFYKDHSIVKKWYPLEGGGEVELVLQWHYNHDLDYDPFEAFAEEWRTFKGKEPNELRIALFQAQGLAAKDKNFISKNSSDPRVSFFLVSDIKQESKKPVFQSHVKEATLEPVFKEQFALAQEMPKSGNLTLRCLVEDVDEITSADYMGEFSIDLATLTDLRVNRQWHELKAVGKGEVSGYVELIVQWGHEPALAFDPFADSKYAGREPNQLRIGLSRGRELLIADKNLVSAGGSSDPRVRFEIPGTAECKATSTHKSKTLEPVWKEVFDFDNLVRGPASNNMPAPKLKVIVEDYDAVSSADPMGEFELDLADLTDQVTRKEWHSLSTQGEIQLVLQWRYNPDLDYEPFKKEDDDLEEEANELRVACVRATRLPALDNNLLSANSSDPRCVLKLSSSTIERKTKAKKQTLEPMFKEQFIWGVSPSSRKKQTLTIRCEDVDGLSKADLMGEVVVSLETLAKTRYERKWHLLSEGGAVELICQWRHNPANKYAPFASPENTKKQPNELKIALSQGRELIIRDANLLSKGGSSDPFVKFALSGTSVKFASTVKEKTLDPIWREVWSQALPKMKKNEPLPKLEVGCFDYNALTSSDPMGTFEVDLTSLLEPHVISKQWYECKGGSGEIELVLLWRYNQDLDYEPFGVNEDAEAAKYAHKEPNELRVAVAQGRNLAIKDKNLLSAGGTSDPRLLLTVTGGTSTTVKDDGIWKKKTKTIKKSLNPRWREVFSFPLERGCAEAGDASPGLHVACEDVDTASSSDYMGSILPLDGEALVELGKSKQVKRGWYSLQPADSLDSSKKSANVHGDVELYVQWRFNPVLDYDPFEADDANPYLDYDANELRLALVRGRGLEAKDNNLLTEKSSDPRVTFEFAGETFKSKTQKATVNPVWKEQFVKPMFDEKGAKHQTIRVKCEDVDTLSTDDLGSFEVDLEPSLKSQKVEKKWFPLEGSKGALELIVQTWHNPARERDRSKAERDAQKAAAMARREEKSSAAEASRKEVAETADAKKADEKEVRKKQLDEEAGKRRALKSASDGKKAADDAGRAKSAADLRAKRQSEADAGRAEEDEKRRRALKAAAEKERREDEAARLLAEEGDAEKARKRQEAADKDALDRARRRRALAKRKLAADAEKARLEADEAARRAAAKETRDHEDERRRQAELRRRADENARLADEERRRKERRALGRQRRLESEAQRRADDDARRAREEAYRAELAMRRSDSMKRQTAARLARETEERLTRERELRAALADGSRNWAPQHVYTSRDTVDAGTHRASHLDPFLVVPPPPPAYSSSSSSLRRPASYDDDYSSSSSSKRNSRTPR